MIVSTPVVILPWTAIFQPVWDVGGVSAASGEVVPAARWTTPSGWPARRQHASSPTTPARLPPARTAPAPTTRGSAGHTPRPTPPSTGPAPSSCPASVPNVRLLSLPLSDPYTSLWVRFSQRTKKRVWSVVICSVSGAAGGALCTSSAQRLSLVSLWPDDREWVVLKYWNMICITKTNVKVHKGLLSRSLHESPQRLAHNALVGLFLPLTKLERFLATARQAHCSLNGTAKEK